VTRTVAFFSVEKRAVYIYVAGEKYPRFFNSLALDSRKYPLMTMQVLASRYALLLVLGSAMLLQLTSQSVQAKAFDCTWSDGTVSVDLNPLFV
jgi:hypothetical protein